MRTPLLIAAVALGGLMTPSAADAYWWHGAGTGIGSLYRSLDYPTERRVPYFAAHPPVYYSHPVPRTYGYSPFAYTPDTRTPDAPCAASQPVTIVNPYVESSANGATRVLKPQSSAPTRGRTISDQQDSPKKAPAKSGPLMIVNPYFDANESKTI